MIRAKFFVFMIVALAAFCVTLAAGTVTTFKTGPFTGSVDLGMPCNDINISKPVSSEDLGGNGYTIYDIRVCNANIRIRQWNKDANYSFDLNSRFPRAAVNDVLIKNGAENMDPTTDLYDRTIDGKLGVVGSGYVPKYDTTLYSAGFDISSKSYLYIFLWGNQTEMISAIKTIHITEAAQEPL